MNESVINARPEYGPALQSLIAEQQHDFAERHWPYLGGNLLAAVHCNHRASTEHAPYSDGLVESAKEAAALARDMNIPHAVDPQTVAGVLSRGVRLLDDGETSIGDRPLVYPTLEEKVAAANAFIAQRAEQASVYPYYDLYKAHGLLHHDDKTGVPYLVLYRSANGVDSTQLAGGFRAGNLSLDELNLPPSVREASVDGTYGEEDYAAYEQEFPLEYVEAYMIGQSGHELSPYLSATHDQKFADSVGGDTIFTLHVPAWATLPATFMFATIMESRGLHLNDQEQEIAIAGRLLPEWIVDQRRLVA